MKPVHKFLLVAFLWTGAFWWPVGLSSAGLFPIKVPLILMFPGGLGLLVWVYLFARREAGEHPVWGVFGRTFDWRIPLRWWVAAMVPAALVIGSMIVFCIIAPPDGYIFAVTYVPALLFVLFLAWVEEVVWRGYALPRLLEIHTPAKASLVLGVMWMFWHMPLYWRAGYNEWGPAGWLAWAPFYLVYTFFMTWLGMNTRFSVAVATFSHFMVNWVISWIEPEWIENVGSLGGAVLLAIFLLFKFPRQQSASSPEPAENAGDT